MADDAVSAAIITMLEGRIQALREGILEARREGCACDFHLYGQDEDLLTDEALDRYCTQAEENAALQNRIDELERQETGALYLVAQIREALGDNGQRMQDELLAYCRRLVALSGYVKPMLTAGDEMCHALLNSLGNDMDYLKTPGDGAEEAENICSPWELLRQDVLYTLRNPTTTGDHRESR